MAREYYLISKNIGQSFVKYKGNAMRLSTKLPYYVDEVLVCVKGQIGKERKITTFKDSDGNIIERIFDYFDKPLRNQIHKQQTFTKGEDLYITTNSINEYTLKRSIINIYREYRQTFEKLNIRTALWNNIKIENNHLCENINTGEKIFSQSSVTNIKQPTKHIHSFIEFPHIINGKRYGNMKKILQFIVNSKNNSVTEVITQQNVHMPKKDSFITFRALDFNTLKESITRFFIKNRGLSKMGIGIDTEYRPTCNEIDRISAIFNSGSGRVNFNKFWKFKSKPHIVSTSRHEVEHGWQYYLDARNSGGRYQWQMETAKKFGQIRNKQLKKEANRCTKSIKNYIPYYQDYKKYKMNYIERRANNEGLKARNSYVSKAKEISNAFPYIPIEML